MERISCICESCNLVVRHTKLRKGRHLCNKCLNIEMGLIVKCNLCTVYTKIKRLFDGYCKLCSSCVELEHKVYKSARTVKYDNSCRCPGCKKIYSAGVIFKNYLDKIYCIHCYNDVLKSIDTEKESHCASERDIYDLERNRLCDIVGCNKFGPHLNNAFNGFFCHKHFEDIKHVRKIMKETSNIVEEYNMRVWEINNRKITSVEHISHAHMLYFNITNPRYIYANDHLPPPGLFSSESEYINTIFHWES